MGRKKARDNAFKCIYQLGFENCNSVDDILNYCYEENNNIEDEVEYISKVTNGVSQNLEKIDSVILSKLKNWSIQRISKIDLAILRLAIYELMYMKDIPDKVTANVSRQLANQTITGSKSKEQWISSECNELFVLVVADAPGIKEDIKNQITSSYRNEQAVWQQIQAKDALKEMDKEIDKVMNTPNNQLDGY